MRLSPSGRGLGRRAGTNCQDVLWARPAKRKFVLGYLGVGVSLHALEDVRSCVVHPCPTTHGEFRGRTQRLGGGGASAFNLGNGEGMVLARNIVRVPLSVCTQVAVGQVISGQTLVSRDSGAFENRQGQTWKSTQVRLVGLRTRHRPNQIALPNRREGAANPTPGRSLTTIASIWAIVWFTRSTPPLPLR